MGGTRQMRFQTAGRAERTSCCASQRSGSPSCPCNGWTTRLKAGADRFDLADSSRDDEREAQRPVVPAAEHHIRGGARRRRPPHRRGMRTRWRASGPSSGCRGGHPSVRSPSMGPRGLPVCSGGHRRGRPTPGGRVALWDCVEGHLWRGQRGGHLLAPSAQILSRITRSAAHAADCRSCALRKPPECSASQRKYQ